MIKSTLTIAAIALGTLGTLATAPLAQAQSKIGILDMNGIFTQYHRTKDAEAKLNDARAAAKTELDTRLETLKKSMDEINKLNADFEKPELSKDAKEKAARARDEKVVEARNLDREIAEFRGTRERQLQEQFIRMRKDLIDDIMKIVTEKVKAGGYDLVLDKSGMSMGQVPVVLYSKEGMDFTSEIIELLNKDAAKTAAPAKKQ
jgi:Skp family chaperone for outer membrane proteins